MIRTQYPCVLSHKQLINEKVNEKWINEIKNNQMIKCVSEKKNNYAYEWSGK